MSAVAGIPSLSHLLVWPTRTRLAEDIAQLSDAVYEGFVATLNKQWTS
jgi:hypothetical protein